MDIYTLGCDPELFVKSNNGRIVSSDKVIGKKGIKLDVAGKLYFRHGGLVVRDGVQVELNPLASTCRAILAMGIARCLDAVKNAIGDSGNCISFDSNVEIDEETFKEIPESSKRFGCDPDFGAHNNGARNIVSINPQEFRERCAGGHIHIGLRERSSKSAEIRRPLDEVITTVKLLDIFVGNTSVLIDRDPAAAERRKVYGKAGCYRTPPHGIEYRTLSNFWLKDCRIFSLVFGLVKDAMHLACTHWDRAVELTEKINAQQAIDANDFDAAMYNFITLISFLKGYYTPTQYDPWKIQYETIRTYEHIFNCAIVGFDKIFHNDDVVGHWTGYKDFHYCGWESWCSANKSIVKEAFPV